jgi:hypothetical protein
MLNMKLHAILITFITWTLAYEQEVTQPFTRPLNDTTPILIPEPHNLNWYPDTHFRIDQNTKIVLDNPADTTAAHVLRQEITKSCALHLNIVTKVVGNNSIILQRRSAPRVPCPTKESMRPQAYTLEINPSRCVISGDDQDGLFYGAMTLKQLIAQNEDNCLAGVLIRDYPNLLFRGTRMMFTDAPSWLDSMKQRADYFASLKLNKLILESADLYTSDNAATVNRYFEYCRRIHIEPIPLLQSFGHAGNILLQNPACGEAVYRMNEHFYFIDDTARSLVDTLFKELELKNNGFDDVSNHDFNAWQQDNIGSTIFRDSVNKRAGKDCAMIYNPDIGTSRLWQDVICERNTLYKVSFSIKTHAVVGTAPRNRDDPVGAVIEIHGYEEDGGWLLLKRSHSLQKSQNWQECSVVLESNHHERLRVYVGLYNAKGRIWIDGERTPVLTNGEFDEPINQDWHLENVGEGIVIEQNTAFGKSDSSCCKISVNPTKRPSGLYTRLYQDVEVEPGYDYCVRAWVKTEKVIGRGCFVTAFWVANDGKQYWKHKRAEFYDFLMSDTVAGTTNWTEISTYWFSSGPCEKIRVKLALDGVGTGYFDNVRIEKINNALRNIDPTSPLIMTAESGQQYREGVDYKLVTPSKLKFPYDLNAAPSYIIRNHNGNIGNSEIVSLTYAKFPAFQHRRDKYGYCYCPTKPETRNLMTTIIRNALNWKPKMIHFGHDEIDIMKTDYQCLKSGRTRAGLLAYDINTLYQAIKPVKMMIWEDMLNPYHTGNFFPDDPTYYAADSINKNIVLAIWFYRENEPFTLGDSTISYFGSRGLTTIAAPAGYQPVNAYNWAREIRHRWLDLGDSSCFGLLNVTWVHSWDFSNTLWISLPITSEYSWQWPDTSEGRTWGALRYDPMKIHLNYGDIFVPRPTGLKCERLGDRVTRLTWLRNRNSDMQHYNIYRNANFLAATTDTFYIDNTSGDACTYQVTAIDTLNNESIYSRKCVFRR